MFFKKRCFHTKTLVLESLFDKVGGFQAEKRDANTRVFLEILHIFKEQLIYRTLPMAAPVFVCFTELLQSPICDPDKHL